MAFCFLPISLSTGIFGMNIQDINSTGHHIWAFFVTTIVLLVAAALIFGISVYVMKCRRELIEKKIVKQKKNWERPRLSFWEILLCIRRY